MATKVDRDASQVNKPLKVEDHFFVRVGMQGMSAGAPAGYRPDIDGLRGVAVASVVTYHFFHGALPAGYLGVDIFFVISGYLITSILVGECEAGSYSILRFYERRIRRIIPALLYMILVVSALAAFLYLSGDLIGYSKSVFATLGFVSNVYFWRDTNYFSAAAHTKPLLHTWSLGIEEQFYIFSPILMYFVMRRGGRRSMLDVAIAITVISFGIAALALALNKSAPAFYLLPMRAWELGIGSILALLPVHPSAKPRYRAAAAWTGAALVAGALVGLNPFAPIPEASFVCAGTAMLIWAGADENPLRRLLACPPMVALGLISYSLYLWHWPIHVLARYALIRDPSSVEGVPLLMLSLGLAAASWRYVERPFRMRAMPFRRVLRVSGIGIAALGGVAGATILLNGLPGRFSPQAAEYNRVAGTNYNCQIRDYLSFGSFYACPVNLPDRNPASADLVILGNSHAQMYVPALEPELRRRNLHGLLVPANGCVPVTAFNLSAPCLDVAARNLDAVAALPRVRVVILAFAWASLDQPMVDPSGSAIGRVGWPARQSGLEETIRRLQNAGKKVILVGPIPLPGYDVARVVSREIAFRGGPRSPLGQPRSDFDRRFGRVEAWLDRLPPGVIAIRPSVRFCDRLQCRFLIDGRPAYSDDNHLSASAMPAFQPLFGSAIEGALAARAETPAMAGPSPE
jgi:peptidoglycan/LPS O-acetylase OafA/YrhL